MNFRKKFGHCLAAFGPLLLLGSYAVATPICHQVFTQKSITAADISQAIHDIALLKVQADTTLAAEVSSGVLPRKQATKLYTLKLNELVRLLEGQETITSLKQKIRAEINNIQVRNNEGKESEKSEKVREENIRRNNLISYDLKEQHKLNDKDLTAITEVKYLPESQQVILLDQNLHTYDLTSQKLSNFGATAHKLWDFSADGKKLLSMDESWDHIIISDTATGKSLSRFPLTEQQQHAKIVLSPDSKTVLYYNLYHFVLFDATHGKVIDKFTEEDTKITWIDSISFVSNNEVLISSGIRIYLYDLSTHTKIQKDIASTSKPILSTDRSQFTVSKYDNGSQTQQVGTYLTKDLSLISSTSLPVNFKDTPRSVHIVPGSNDFLLMRGLDSNGQQEIQITPKNDIESYVFDWLDHYKKTDRDIEAVSFSSDAQELLIISVEHNNGARIKKDRTIDIWKRHHEELTE